MCSYSMVIGKRASRFVRGCVVEKWGLLSSKFWGVEILNYCSVEKGDAKFKLPDGKIPKCYFISL